MKNKLLIYILIAGVAGTTGLSSCGKKLDELYQNPNSPTVVPIESLLPDILSQMVGSAGAIGGGGGGSYGTAYDGIYVGRYIQYWNYYASKDQYDQMGGPSTGSDIMGAIWAAHYYGIGKNGLNMIAWGKEQQKWDYVGVGYAIFAWSLLTLTDYHGDVILRDAFNTTLQTFRYDDQSMVYDTVRSICFQALSNLNRTDGNVSQQNLALGDAYCNNGDVNKWKKFVYAVLARSYQHLSSKAIYQSAHYADSAIKYCDLTMQTNDDNTTLKFAGLSRYTGSYNFYGPTRANMGTVRQSAFIAALESGTNTAFSGVFDPRAYYIIRENPNGTFKGLVPNYGQSVLGTNDQPRNFWGSLASVTSAPALDTGGRYLFTNTAEFPIITASEMQFLKAEAAYKKGDKAVALAAYTKGIDLDFDMLTSKYDSRVPAARKITPATKAAFLSNTTIVPTDPNALTLSMIMLQKYIALYGYGTCETWVDMRKYHYTDKDPVTGKQVYTDFAPPQGGDLYTLNNNRLVYRVKPRYNSEYLYNVPELTRIGAMSNDYNTLECWFSQQ